MATIKQKIAAKVVVDGGLPTDGMRIAKYKPSVIRKPAVLTKSKGWQELMEQHLPDKDLAKKHRELLNKREIVYSYVNGKKEAEVIDQPDTQAVSRALDLAYKIKKKYPAEGSSPILTISQLLILINGGTKETKRQELEGK